MDSSKLTAATPSMKCYTTSSSDCTSAATLLMSGSLRTTRFRAWWCILSIVGMAEPVVGRAQSCTGVGDLPGGAFRSRANAISADGRVVVGESWSGSGDSEGFRWEQGVLVPLGDLDGGVISSLPKGVSADGGVIVG